MNIINPVNRVVLATVLLAGGFVALVSLVNMDTLIVVLNGIFFGSMAAVMVAYGRLLANAILGIQPYDRIRQMTLGFALCWFAYGLAVFVSVYFRSSGAEMNTSLLTAAGRYIAIIAAILQVTAPDFGLGLFHGKDRKILVVAIPVGIIISILTVMSQTSEVLAEDF